MDKQTTSFTKALDKLIEVACDWRLAWDGTGPNPELRLQRARAAVMRAYKRGRAHSASAESP